MLGQNQQPFQQGKKLTSETLQGVLGSGENGVQKCREQGAWGQKDQGAGSKGNVI